MNPISSSLFDLLTYEIVDKIVKSKWDQTSVKQYTLLCDKLENIGYKTGLAWAELRTLDNPKWETAEDTITDIATYFWEQMFGKNADEIVIGTNGVSTIVDQDFRPTRSVSSSDNNEKVADVYVVFYNGVIRGILSCAGYNTTIHYEMTDTNQCIWVYDSIYDVGSFTLSLY